MTPAPLDLAALPGAGLGSAPLAGVLTMATAAPTPSPSLRGGPDPADISPGLLGFLPVFLIALACIGLFLSLTSKLRKVNRRQAREDAEEAADAGSPAPGTDTAGHDIPDDPAVR